jgi:acyl carrier protein
MQATKSLEKFMLETLPFARKRRSIGPDEDLLGGGIIDSVGLMEVVSFVEQEYGIEVADDDVVPDNFRSLQRIAEFVERKRDSRGVQR